MPRPDWHVPPDSRVLAWVARSAGAGWRPVRATRLRGGVALAVDAVTLQRAGGGMLRLVLRRWLRPDWEAEDQEFSATREAMVLERIAATSVPAPRLVAVDADGSQTGAPAILMTHVEGRHPSVAEERLPRRIAAMATVLAGIHAADAGLRAVVAPFRPFYGLERLRAPAATVRPRLWRDAFALAAWSPAAPNACLIHRDYHPGNTIWRTARLVGVVDWTTASWGPPAVDLAHWRANLGTRHGADVAEQVLDAYAATTGRLPADQAWWDVRMLLDFLDEPDALTAAELAAFEGYLAALLRRT